jgi:hypothetical protein
MATFSHRHCDTQEIGEGAGMHEGPKELVDTPTSREREVKHSRHVIANAKVVVTFSVGIAAAFVTQVMQKTDDPSGWDEWAMKLMGLTLVITVVVILLPPGHQRGELTDRAACRAKWRARVAYGLMVVQVILSTFSVVAVVGLLRPEWRWLFGWH